MRIITDLKRWAALRRNWRGKGFSVGFVPTMGALHAGHVSLVERSVREHDRTVVSVFVNPTQFNDENDLSRYPRTPRKDAALLSSAGADCLLMPDFSALYPDGYAYRVSESRNSRLLCGAFRPGHFDGVLTVVLKLLNLVSPDAAYFGEKDYQQYSLIKGMARAFFLAARIVSCPTVREEDGLAMSSRNALLSPAERNRATLLYKTLKEGKSASAARRRLQKAGFSVDYVSDIGGRRYAAAFLGKVRLIDNVEI